jgi:hypothetical protein
MRVAATFAVLFLAAAPFQGAFADEHAELKTVSFSLASRHFPDKTYVVSCCCSDFVGET